MRVLIDNVNGDPFRHLDGCDTTGQNLFAHYLARHLSARGVDVTVSTRATGGEDASSDGDGVTVWRVPAGPPHYLFRDDVAGLLSEYTEGLASRIQRQGEMFDIVHGNYWLSAPVVCAIKDMQLARALAYTPHSLGRVKSQAVGIAPPLRDGYECEVIASADLVHVLSTDEREALRALYPPASGTVALVGHGVDGKVFPHIPKDEARRKLAWQWGDRIVLFVGRFEEQKDLPLAMRVFARLAAEDGGALHRYRMVICGGPAGEGGVRSAQLPDDVRNAMGNVPAHATFAFLGRIPNRELHTYYCAADLLLMPSLYEPFGLVAVEALACGLPVVASEVGGLRKTILPSQTGYHAQPGNEAEFVDAARRLFEVSWQCEGKRRWISEATCSRFSWEEAVDRLLDAYEGVLRD